MKSFFYFLSTESTRFLKSRFCGSRSAPSVLITYIPDFILGNEMFRCAFIDLYYEVGKNAKMGEDTDKRLINTIIRELKYKNILIAKHNSPNPGFLVYIPYF